MSAPNASPLQKALGSWVEFVCRKAIQTVLLATLLTVAVLYYAITHIGISTDTTDMLSPDLPFRQNSIALSEAFPQFSDNIVAVIEGPNADQVNEAADQFAGRLRQQPALFGEVFDPAGLAFFRQNGLLYLEADALAELSDRLIAAQPFLGTLWKNPTLPGLFDLLSLFLKEGADNQDLLGAAEPMIRRMTAVMSSKRHLSWRAILSGESPQSETRIIVIQPKTDFTSLQPGEDAINGLRSIGRELELAKKFNARLRLTGSIPLAEEELASVVEGLGLAGALSLTLVLVLLFWGLKSARLVLATLITLLFGLVWTAGFAALAVGTLNLISVAFTVLFIGLSVDFAIHYNLRFLESRDAPHASLQNAARKVGGALSLSAIAAAIGFFSFLPTDYRGLAELGLIAGGGMFIALFANLTLLPALISLMPPKQARIIIQTKPARSHPGIIIGAGLLALLALFIAPKVVFDFDPMNLKDTKTESVATFFDLIKSKISSPYAITILAKDLATADKIAARAKKLSVVKSATTLSSLIPSDQADKLAMIDTLALVLGPAFAEKPGLNTSHKSERLRATRGLQQEIQNFKATNSALGAAVEKLGNALSRLLGAPNPNPGLSALEQRLLTSLPRQLSQLKHALNAEEISAADIPKALHDRQIAIDGRAKVEITAKGNMRNRQELEAFVAAIRTIAPEATGTPVVILEAGNTVIDAFTQAAILTLILITLLVITITRSLREIILIFAPLFLAALLTLAASVLLSLPFNFANVIVLPLLFGLGIAGSIHIVLRDRGQIGDTQSIMSTSTPRAVIFSALTTIASFGSIALSSHPGTASMGILLSIAIALSLICTLVFLPALLIAWPKKAEAWPKAEGT